MRFLDIRNALIKSWLDGSFGLQKALPGKDFTPVTGTPWAKLDVVPAQPSVDTLGDNGQDVHEGFFQVTLNYPLDSGDSPALRKADEMAARYKAGARFYAPNVQSDPDWVELCVLIRSCGVSQPSSSDGWQRTVITIYYSAWVSRA